MRDKLRGFYKTEKRKGQFQKVRPVFRRTWEARDGNIRAYRLPPLKLGLEQRIEELEFLLISSAIGEYGVKYLAFL